MDTNFHSKENHQIPNNKRFHNKKIHLFCHKLEESKDPWVFEKVLSQNVSVFMFCEWISYSGYKLNIFRFMDNRFSSFLSMCVEFYYIHFQINIQIIIIMIIIWPNKKWTWAHAVFVGQNVWQFMLFSSMLFSPSFALSNRIQWNMIFVIQADFLHFPFEQLFWYFSGPLEINSHKIERMWKNWKRKSDMNKSWQPSTVADTHWICVCFKYDECKWNIKVFLFRLLHLGLWNLFQFQPNWTENEWNDMNEVYCSTIYE